MSHFSRVGNRLGRHLLAERRAGAHLADKLAVQPWSDRGVFPRSVFVAGSGVDSVDSSYQVAVPKVSAGAYTDVKRIETYDEEGHQTTGEIYKPRVKAEIYDEEGWDSGDDEDIRKKQASAPKKKILLVGNGNMGGSVLKGIYQDHSLEITVVSPRIPTLGRELPGVRYVTPEEFKLETEKFDSIILGIKPQKVAEVLPQYGDRLEANGLVLSLLAGTSCEAIAKYFPEGTAIVRSMPNLAAMTGESMTGLYGNQFITEGHYRDVSEMASSFGQIIWLPSEAAIDRITAASASGIGFMFEMMRVYSNQLVDRLGFSEEEARMLTEQTMRGALAVSSHNPHLSLEDMRKKVTSPNGTTQEGLRHLMRECVVDRKVVGQLDNIFGDTLEATYIRAQELKRTSMGLPLLEDRKPPVQYAESVAAFRVYEARKKEEETSHYKANPATGHGFLPDSPGGSPGGSSGTPAGGTPGHTAGC